MFLFQSMLGSAFAILITTQIRCKELNWSGLLVYFLRFGLFLLFPDKNFIKQFFHRAVDFSIEYTLMSGGFRYRVCLDSLQVRLCISGDTSGWQIERRVCGCVECTGCLLDHSSTLQTQDMNEPLQKTVSASFDLALLYPSNPLFSLSSSLVLFFLPPPPPPPLFLFLYLLVIFHSLLSSKMLPK